MWVLSLETEVILDRGALDRGSLQWVVIRSTGEAEIENLARAADGGEDWMIISEFEVFISTDLPMLADLWPIYGRSIVVELQSFVVVVFD